MDRFIRWAVIGYALWLTQPRLLAQDAESLLRDYAHFAMKGGDRTSGVQDAPSGSGADTPAPRGLSPAPESPTTVCRCQGYKEHLCLCLKAGVKCHCSRTVGSVWAVNDQGRATHKTGAKADPRKPSPLTTPPATVHRTPKADGFALYMRQDGRWGWTDATGRQWWAQTQPKAGDTVTDGQTSWECTGTGMRPKMVVNLQPSGGRWVKRCYGGYCRMEWVPN